MRSSIRHAMESIESIKNYIPSLAKLTDEPAAKAPTLLHQTIISDPLTRPKESPLLQWNSRAKLKAKIRDSHMQIAAHTAAHNAQITPRTRAHNRKCVYQTVEAQHEFRGDILKGQIRVWKSMLPNLIKRFAKIPDPRRATSVSHKITVLMIFGLFSFVFKLESRREMNRELTGAVIYENMKKIFPGIDSIPHADTLARILEKISSKSIEATHIGLIQELIRKKKFRSLMIAGCLPVSVDGAQKLYRDGFLQDPRWCERMVGAGKNKHKQQYVYAIEANITLKNGLNIPLMTEFLYRENNCFLQPKGKQDNEITAFERLAVRIKKYFPRQKIIFFMDSMYATFHTMEIIKTNGWEFIITLPTRKFKKFAKVLNKEKKHAISAPDREYWRGRKQEFYWQNNLDDDEARGLKVHLVGCLEEYEEVDVTTGEIKKNYSTRAWMSSIMIFARNLHELINEGARKKEMIEDSMNTEKNRGYSYKHAFSYNFNAMQGFHYLMRIGHAINAISEFSKSLKKYIKIMGVSPTLKIIRDTLFNPWLPSEWYERCCIGKPQLRLQLE